MRCLHRILFVILLLLLSLSLGAEEYPRLDGGVYNGLAYPNIDILEWGDPLHLEVQIYNPSFPVAVSGYTQKKGSGHSFILAFDFPERGERLCRRVPAPPGFREGKEPYFYIDKEKDRHVVYVSAQKLEDKKSYPAPVISSCSEQSGEEVAEGVSRIPQGAPGPVPLFEDNEKSPVSPPSDKKPTEEPRKDIKYQPIDDDFSWF